MKSRYEQLTDHNKSGALYATFQKFSKFKKRNILIN